jgi:hypothetical protein
MPRAHDAIEPPSRARLARDRRTRGGLFPCEAEIARRLSQEPRDWTAKAILLERDGLPKIDAVMGGRYWPAVLAWWNRRYGLSTIEAFNPDGMEDLNAL